MRAASRSDGPAAATGRLRRRRLLALGAGALVVCPAVVGTARAAPAASVVWQAPERIPSPPLTSSWFPDVAVDREGRAHVVWSESDHSDRPIVEPDKRHPLEEMYYAVWTEGTWSPPRPITVRQAPIVRGSIAADAGDVLHLLLDYCPGAGYDLYYRQAPASRGFGLGNWGVPRRINTRWNTLVSDIALYDGVIHAVYDDAGALEGPCPGCSDIYYRRSGDGGRTWSQALNLRPSAVGSARAQIEVDGRGALHVAWDEGQDSRTRHGPPQMGIYLSSPDGGQTWTEPRAVGDPSAQSSQLAVGTSGSGGVMLVWRTRSHPPRLHYQWSTDGGQSWTETARIEPIVPSPTDGRNDAYDLTTDREGRIHLLAAGEPDEPVEGGRRLLYHLEWDGRAWSRPEPLYRGDRVPERARMAVGSEGRLHAVWFTRGDRPPHDIWFATARARPGAAPAAVPMHAGAVPASYVPPTAVPPSYTTRKPPDYYRVTFRPRQLLVLAGALLAGAVIVGAQELAGRVWRRMRGRG